MHIFQIIYNIEHTWCLGPLRFPNNWLSNKKSLFTYLDTVHGVPKVGNTFTIPD